MAGERASLNREQGSPCPSTASTPVTARRLLPGWNTSISDNRTDVLLEASALSSANRQHAANTGVDAAQGGAAEEQALDDQVSSTSELSDSARRLANIEERVIELGTSNEVISDDISRNNDKIDQLEVTLGRKMDDMQQTLSELVRAQKRKASQVSVGPSHDVDGDQAAESPEDPDPAQQQARAPPKKQKQAPQRPSTERPRANWRTEGDI